MSHKPRIALCCGDPAGVGPELCLQVARDRQVQECCKPIIIGDPELLTQVAHRVRRALADANTTQISSDTSPIADVDIIKPAGWTLSASDVTPGKVAAKHGLAAVMAVEHAALGCLKTTGKAAPAADILSTQQATQIETDQASQADQTGYDAMVTAPWHKAAVQAAQVDVPGHTEFLQRICGADHVVMMLHSPALRVALLTIHQSLASVPSALSTSDTIRIAQTVHQQVSYELGRPARLTLLGLNPHAGESGHFGDEERTILQPAVDQLRLQGVDITDPISADTAFLPGMRQQTDAYIACYHDQGLIPFKTLAFHDGVNCTLGLPIIRTSPDHGTAFDIAWQGVADSTSMKSAVLLAAQLAQRQL